MTGVMAIPKTSIWFSQKYPLVSVAEEYKVSDTTLEGVFSDKISDHNASVTTVCNLFAKSECKKSSRSQQ
jgi:hypothetical protein